MRIVNSFLLLFFSLFLINATAADYKSLRIEPKNIGVFVDNEKQQFYVYGQLANGSWTKNNINTEVDWYLEPYPFSEQTATPDSIITIDSNGLATIKKNVTWGRVNVAVCFPRGCSGVTPPAPPNTPEPPEIILPPVGSKNPNAILPIVVSVLFDTPLYNLTASVETGSGKIKDTSNQWLALDCNQEGKIFCKTQYRENATVNLIAIPERGNSLIKYTGACLGSLSNNCSVLMESDKNVGVLFETFKQYPLVLISGTGGNIHGLIEPFNVTLSCDSGNTCCGNIAYDTEIINLIAKAEDGYTFMGWSGCDSVSGEGKEVCQTKVDGIELLVASFAIKE